MHVLIIFLHIKIIQRMIDFSLRHLNFPLNELQDNRYCIYTKEQFILEKRFTLEEHNPYSLSISL